MASLGLNTYRFSIEWSRIETEPGQYSRSAIEHYRDVLETCRNHGMTPVVAMHHFSSPKWLMRLGGWASPEVPDRFAKYCEVVFCELGHLDFKEAVAVIEKFAPGITKPPAKPEA